jgi:hypothetical protein
VGAGRSTGDRDCGCPPASTVSGTDLRDGTVHAIDVNGREVNTASFSGADQSGWKIDTTEYDATGNVIRTLSAANREFALSANADQLATLGLSGQYSAQIARTLNTQNFYSSDGIDLTDTFGPLHIGTGPNAAVACTSQLIRLVSSLCRAPLR